MPDGDNNLLFSEEAKENKGRAYKKRSKYTSDNQVTYVYKTPKNTNGTDFATDKPQTSLDVAPLGPQGNENSVIKIPQNVFAFIHVWLSGGEKDVDKKQNNGEIDPFKYIKSLTVNRKVRTDIAEGFEQSLGATNAKLVLFDPDFNVLQETIETCTGNDGEQNIEIAYGLQGDEDRAIHLKGRIVEISESISSAGIEWELEVACYQSDKVKLKDFYDADDPTFCTEAKKYKSPIARIVVQIIHEMGWRIGYVNDDAYNGKRKFSTQKYTVAATFIQKVLLPLARTKNKNGGRFVFYFGLDGVSVFFHEDNITMKDNSKTPLLLQKTLYYGTKDSIIQNLDISWKSLAHVRTRVMLFSFVDKKTHKKVSFRYPDVKSTVGAVEDPVERHLNVDNMTDAKAMASKVLNYFNEVYYTGTATLVNYPYITPLTRIMFKYMVPTQGKIINAELNKNALDNFTLNKGVEKDDPLTHDSTLEKHNKTYRNTSMTGLNSWTTEHKASRRYLVTSVTDTVSGGFIKSTLELRSEPYQVIDKK